MSVPAKDNNSRTVPSTGQDNPEVCLLCVEFCSFEGHMDKPRKAEHDQKTVAVQGTRLLLILEVWVLPSGITCSEVCHSEANALYGMDIE